MIKKLTDGVLKILTDSWVSLKGKKTNLALLSMFLAPILAQYGIIAPTGFDLAPYVLGVIGILDKFGIFGKVAKALKELLR